MSTANRKIAIVTDGACSITPAEGHDLGLEIIPIYINFELGEYLAGVNLSSDEFYRLLRQSKQLPKTSQPTAQDFLKVYSELAKQVDEIVTVTVSHHLSATIDSACMACQQMPDFPIYVVDTQSVSMGQCLLALAALRAAREGRSGEQIARMVETLASRLELICAVDTLEYLHKGGRIGGATAFLGSALSIKPILYIKDGRIEPLERQRTRKRAIARLLELLEERVGSQEIHAAVLHCDAAEEARDLAEQISARFNCAEMHTVEAGPVIGTHAGPGTLGFTCYKSTDIPSAESLG
ncbi:MAG: DegV family protein [Chloroflexota bacterium]